MKREDIKLAAELDKRINELEGEIQAWEKSVKFSTVPQLQTDEGGLAVRYYKVNMGDIPFSVLKSFMIKELTKIRDYTLGELNKLLS